MGCWSYIPQKRLDPIHLGTDERPLRFGKPLG